jgi:hypothetical protein
MIEKNKVDLNKEMCELCLDEQNSLVLDRWKEEIVGRRNYVENVSFYS